MVRMNQAAIGSITNLMLFVTIEPYKIMLVEFPDKAFIERILLKILIKTTVEITAIPLYFADKNPIVGIEIKIINI
jgi:hypothetical protein